VSLSTLAIALIGFLIGLSIFCDSGFIVLSGVVLTLAQRLERFHLRLMLLGKDNTIQRW
jgi:gluconate:H+ symporter, GntP family